MQSAAFSSNSPSIFSTQMSNKQSFSSEDTTTIITKVKKLLSETPYEKKGDLIPAVKNFLVRRDVFLKIAKKYPTPFYILDSRELNNSIEQFNSAFTKNIPRFHVYYAMKTNHHSFILRAIV